jgi:hypothetical protein
MTTQLVTEFLDAMQDVFDGYGPDYRYPGYQEAREALPAARAGDRSALGPLLALSIACPEPAERLGQQLRWELRSETR